MAHAQGHARQPALTRPGEPSARACGYVQEMQPPDAPALRQTVLAVSVLSDIDISPSDDGVVLVGPPSILVGWAELATAVRGAAPASDAARLRLAAWLSGRLLGATWDSDDLRAVARPVGLPIGHVLHPGHDWVRHRVHGGALDLGFGFVGVGADPDTVTVIPPGALHVAGINPLPWWPVALHYLERMGSVAADRLPRSTVLRPIGDCDVVTLLASKALRKAACAIPNSMRAAAVPIRSRGWLDPSRIDPAFTSAAAAATDPVNRGFARPVLLTVDEVALAVEGGRPAEIVLRDPAVPRTPLTGLRFT